VCDSPDRAAHYHTLGPKLGVSSLTRHLAGLEVKVVLVYVNRNEQFDVAVRLYVCVLSNLYLVTSFPD
jgi:hypothetical protein